MKHSNFQTAFGIALTSLGNNPPKGVKWNQILFVQLLEELMHIFMVSCILMSSCVC